MRGLDSDVVPKRFNGVELGTVSRQRAKMETVSKTAKPFPHFRRPMVSGIIVDQEHLLTGIALGQAIQESGVAPPLKPLAMPVVEPGPIQIDGAKNLLRVALASGRNQRLVTSARPRLVEARILPETGFIGEQQGRVALCGFFLAQDTCVAATGPVPVDRLGPACAGVAEPKTPAT